MVDYPQRGSIIYIDFDPSVGAEIRKRRPAVVIFWRKHPHSRGVFQFHMVLLMVRTIRCMFS
jgi:mRNA-degrading endonuclease toxin of MazEF toxin-antitoxin module